MWFLPLLTLLFFNYVAASEVEVVTPLGKISGTTLVTRLGKPLHAFRGIRYAKSPINDLRFKPPVPIEPWSGIYNATVDGPLCPQPTKANSENPVSEDCLMLNVYTNKLPSRAHNPRRPVIIFLHAGAFFFMSGRSNWAGPQYLLDQDIVLVTLNYRIGSLGFISVGKEAPGNNGLKDQVVAMKWVKDNIAAFGGDPNSVTLYGYSAGAWSITLHMVSPMSRGLFHKAILGSGAALGPYPLPRNQVNVARRQAKIVGCPDSSVKEIMDCLKTTPAKKLGDSLPQFAEFGSYLGLVWSPVIEEDFGQERFLSDDPVKLIKEGKFEQVPVVGGITKDEFGLVPTLIAGNATLLQELSDNFEKYAPIILLLERGTAKSREVSRAVRKFYLGDRPLSNSSIPGLAKVYSDAPVGFPVHRALSLISEKSTKPVYYYQFTYQGRYSYFYLPGTNNTPSGVIHHDDLMYAFYIPEFFPFINTSFPESKMVDTYTSLWATFAKTGNPINSCNEKVQGIEWIPYNAATKKYLDIGEQLVMKENLFEDRYAFWRKLYPL